MAPIERVRLRYAAIPLLAVAALGCSNVEKTEPVDVEVPMLRLSQSDTIGAEAALGYVVALAAGPAGEVYVADQGQSVIHVFSPNGVAERRIGRHGAGPGEFGRMYSMAWSGDTLAVFDPANGRIEYVDRRGSWVASQPVARVSGGDVRLWQAGENSFYAPALEPSGDGSGVDLILVRRGLKAVPDTIEYPPVQRREEGAVTCRAPGGDIHFWTAPSRPSLVRAVTPDGVLATGWSDSLHLEFTRGDSLVAEWEDSPDVTPLSDSAWEVELEDYHSWRDGIGTALCEPSSPSRPRATPLLQSIEFDDKYRAWLERVGPHGRWYDVRDSTGVPLFRLPAPDRDYEIPFVVRGSHLYYVAESADGGQSVVIATFAENE